MSKNEWKDCMSWPLGPSCKAFSWDWVSKGKGASPSDLFVLVPIFQGWIYKGHVEWKLRYFRLWGRFFWMLNLTLIFCCELMNLKYWESSLVWRNYFNNNPKLWIFQKVETPVKFEGKFILIDKKKFKKNILKLNELTWVKKRKIY